MYVDMTLFLDDFTCLKWKEIQIDKEKCRIVVVYCCLIRGWIK